MRATSEQILKVLDSALSAPKTGKKLSETLAGLQRAVDAAGGSGAASHAIKNVVGTLPKISALVARLTDNATASRPAPAPKTVSTEVIASLTEPEIVETLSRTLDALIGQGASATACQSASDNTQRLSCLSTCLASIVDAMSDAAQGIKATTPTRPATMRTTPTATTKPAATVVNATPASNALETWEALRNSPDKGMEAGQYYQEHAAEILKLTAQRTCEARENIRRQRGY